MKSLESTFIEESKKFESEIDLIDKRLLEYENSPFSDFVKGDDKNLLLKDVNFLHNQLLGLRKKVWEEREISGRGLMFGYDGEILNEIDSSVFKQLCKVEDIREQIRKI